MPPLIPKVFLCPNPAKMPLRNQPYLPLFIKDFLTDEKLVECSASATGVYIRLMCLMHKSEQYGKILLKQKYKQSEQQVLNFATQFANQMPYKFAEIADALGELLVENVLQMSGDVLSQKRMVRDGEISDIRSSSGKVGGTKTAEKNKKIATKFATAKNLANTENANAIENAIENDLIDRGLGKENPDIPHEQKIFLGPRMVEIYKTHFPDYPTDTSLDFPASLEIANKIADAKGWPRESITNGKMPNMLKEWEVLVKFAKGDIWYATQSISMLNKKFQDLTLASKKPTKNGKSHFGGHQSATAGGQDPTVIEREGFGVL